MFCRIALFALLGGVTGCSQLFGLDSPTLDDAATASDAGSDGQRGDASDAASDAGATVTLQRGVNNYVGVTDTYINGSGPSQQNGSQNDLRWEQAQRYALLRFELTGALPNGAVVANAILELRLSQNNATTTFYESAIAWDETATYDTFGNTPGVDGDLGAMVATLGSGIDGVVAIDVTSSVQKWLGGADPNYGWIVVATAGNAVVARASDTGIVTDRPRLILMY